MATIAPTKGRISFQAFFQEVEPAGVGHVQRVVQHIGIAIVILSIGGGLDIGIGLQEATFDGLFHDLLMINNLKAPS